MKRSPDVFIAASAPAAAVGVWSLGARIAETSPDTVESWQIAALEYLGLDRAQPSALSAVALGCAFFVPLLVTSLAVSRAWAEVFSRVRHRPRDSGWAMMAWLYTLLLPATMPLHFAALGLSFGAVFGCYVFGGTGRYIVSPALLGIVFVAIAYPGFMADTQWLPGDGATSSWAAVASGTDPGTVGWLPLFLGNEIGALGAGSTLACLLGAGVLIGLRVASVRIVAASLLSFAAAAWLGGELPWYWHLAVGNFAFVLAFIATDPTTKPRTRGGCWAFGALFGALTIALRVANPEHPEGTWFALLLASLCVPLFDHIAKAAGASLDRSVSFGDE